MSDCFGLVIKALNRRTVCLLIVSKYNSIVKLININIIYNKFGSNCVNTTDDTTHVSHRGLQWFAFVGLTAADRGIGRSGWR